MPLRATRRTAVGGGLATLLALTGCDPLPGSDGLFSADESSGLLPWSDEDQGAVPSTEHDAELLAATVGATAGALAALRAVGGPAPARRALRPLLRLHEHHLALVDPESTVTVGPAERTPGGLRARWAAVHTAERRLADDLADRSVSADSGHFARLLASMSAAVDQHLAGLPVDPPARDGGSGG